MGIYNTGNSGGQIKVVTSSDTKIQDVIIEANITDLTAGTSSLETGKIYLVYEA